MRYLHEIFVTDKGTILLLDVCYTWDAGIEGAYSIFDEETFKEQWPLICEEENTPYGIEEIKEWGEELGCFSCWTVVGNHPRTFKSATNQLMKAVKKL